MSISGFFFCCLHLSPSVTKTKIYLCHFALAHPHSCLQRALPLYNPTSLPLQPHYCLSFPLGCYHPCFLVTKQGLYYAFKPAHPFPTYIWTWPQAVSWLQLLSRCTAEIGGMMLQKHSPHVIYSPLPIRSRKKKWSQITTGCGTFNGGKERTKINISKFLNLRTNGYI